MVEVTKSTKHYFISGRSFRRGLDSQTDVTSQVNKQLITKNRGGVHTGTEDAGSELLLPARNV